MGGGAEMPKGYGNAGSGGSGAGPEIEEVDWRMKGMPYRDVLFLLLCFWFCFSGIALKCIVIGRDLRMR